MKLLKSAMILFFMLYFPLTAQTTKIIFTEHQKGFYEEMSKEIESFRTPKETEPVKTMKVDMSALDLPTSINQFTKSWFNEPVSQGMTGCCWCFSTTSFFESEIYRIHNRKIKLSEMYTVYWEYVEKATRFIKERGNSNFAEGSEGNAVRRIWKKYGIVPAEFYTGLNSGREVVHEE